jgi:aspartyl protease family protein
LFGIAAGLIGLATLVPDLDTPSSNPPADSGGYAIARAPDGQYYTDGRTGGATLRFLVDPRSDRVLIAGADAKRMGLKVGPGFTPVILPRLAIGPHERTQVAATIAPDLPVSLLGRSFLSRLEGAAIEHGRMVLR